MINEDNEKKPLYNGTKENLLKETEVHQYDVFTCMNYISEICTTTGHIHDNTKSQNFDEFYDSLTSIDMDNTPNDVNLIDVMEMISDCCCAGYRRNGDVYNITLSEEVLKKAFDNTVNLIKDFSKEIILKGESDGE